MQIPQNPNDELNRLSALLQTGLLDSPAEERFDRLTKLALHLFDVPIALVSLVDSERQWFKSKQGIDAKATSRNISFCGHAISQPELIFEIPDATQDPRFSDNPLVTGAPFIRFYAGAPLYTDDGFPIGTLCIIDKKPRKLSSVERDALRNLADVVATEINQVDRNKRSMKFKSLQQLSEVIVRAQSNFIKRESRTEAFNLLLEDILSLTESEYGFIGDVLYTPEGHPYLKAQAITNIAWDEASKAFYDAHAPGGLEFRNLNSLFGAAMKSGEPVISNAPCQDPRSGGLPQGHPDLNAFLGIPIHNEDKLVALVGLANKPGGYDQELLSLLKPLLLAIGQIVEASVRQQEQAELKEELNFLSNVASQTTNAVIITDIAGKTKWVNDGFTRLTGYSLDEIKGLKPGDLLQGAETDSATVATMRDALTKQSGFTMDIVNYNKSGEQYWVRIYCNPLVNDSGSLEGYIAIQSDINAEKRNEIVLKESAQLQSTILNTMVDGLVTTNQNGIIQMCNPAIESIFGYPAKWLVGRNIKVLMPDNYADVHDAYLNKYQTMSSSHDIMGKARALTAKRSDGTIFPVEIAVKETTHKGEPLYVGSIRDISALKEQRDEIERLAYFDSLTQLANRRLLEARIKGLLVPGSSPEQYSALLFIDLDNFKNVNDVLGHSLGDELLIEVGQRIHSSTLSCSDTVARLGGDEFCVLLPSLNGSPDSAHEQAKLIAERIIQEIEKPLIIGNERIKTSASIGVTLFCGEKVKLSALMKQADMAMYEAKERGKSRVCFFNADLEARLLRRLTMVSELRTAINEEALTVHYQPIVDSTGRIVKVEALVRWQHPTDGWISPEVFIPIAEAYQLIGALGDLVLKTAISDMQGWLKVNPDLEWRIAINISQFQLAYAHFHQQVEDALTSSGFDARRLVLEVTESALAENIEVSIDRMKALKALGLTFSLDDFGTGYSSLAYLKQLPINELKIDRSFIKDIPDVLDDIAIVNSVLSLAKAMDLAVVAEGVETAEQWQFLKGLQCDRFQGYYFSKPLPATEIEALVMNNKYRKLVCMP